MEYPGREDAVHLHAVAGFDVGCLNHFDRLTVDILAVLAEQHLVIKVLIAGAAVAVAQLGAAQGRANLHRHLPDAGVGQGHFAAARGGIEFADGT